MIDILESRGNLAALTETLQEVQGLYWAVRRHGFITDSANRSTTRRDCRAVSQSVGRGGRRRRIVITERPRCRFVHVTPLSLSQTKHAPVPTTPKRKRRRRRRGRTSRNIDGTAFATRLISGTGFGYGIAVGLAMDRCLLQRRHRNRSQTKHARLADWPAGSAVRCGRSETVSSENQS